MIVAFNERGSGMLIQCKIKSRYLICISLLLIILIGCATNTTVEYEAVTTPVIDVEILNQIDINSYPVKGESIESQIDNDYPILQSTIVVDLPKAEYDVPVPVGGVGSIGGSLVRKVGDNGLVPLVPDNLLLAKVLSTDTGVEAYIRVSEDAPKAELFTTGVFIFRDVAPGKYGLVIDVTYSQFPILDETGSPLLLEIIGDDVHDLGNIITELP